MPGTWSVRHFQRFASIKFYSRHHAPNLELLETLTTATKANTFDITLQSTRHDMDASESAEAPKWPISFRQTTEGQHPSTSRFWSHERYRGPDGQPVRIMYSRTKRESEEIAQEFLGESVVGFDMESVNPTCLASSKEP